MRNKKFSHTPVLLAEAIEYLKVEKGKKYIDATAGGGGHSFEITERGGVVLGIDRDQEALDFIKETQSLKVKNQKLKVVKGNFREIERIASVNGFSTVKGILFDLGVSSYQLDSSERGFSIRNDEKLDMRMDKDLKLTAFDVVNHYTKDQLVEIFYKYGEEHNAEKIAEKIVEARKRKEIKTTKELASIVERISHKNVSIPARHASQAMRGVAGRHPATRVFQAIRIEVNQELEAIRSGIGDAVRLLEKNGRLVVISFHSLEDRVIKKMFDIFEKEDLGKIITKKPILPSEIEKKNNRRSRSAKMRVFERI